MIRLLRIVQLVQILRELGHGSGLVGGLAVSARARERFTKDIDFAIAAASDREAEALAIAMQHRGFRLHTIIEQEAKKMIATIRLIDPTLDQVEPTIDLLFASSGIESEIVASARPLTLAPGITVPVASIGHLVAMKVLSMGPNRDQERGDLLALLAVAKEADHDVARRAVELIVDRGFHRDRDLRADLEHMISLADSESS